MRRKAHEMGALFGGRLPHPPAFVPGGFTTTPRPDRISEVQGVHRRTDLVYRRHTYLPDVDHARTLLRSDYFADRSRAPATFSRTESSISTAAGQQETPEARPRGERRERRTDTGRQRHHRAGELFLVRQPDQQPPAVGWRDDSAVSQERRLLLVESAPVQTAQRTRRGRWRACGSTAITEYGISVMDRHHGAGARSAEGRQRTQGLGRPIEHRGCRASTVCDALHRHLRRSLLVPPRMRMSRVLSSAWCPSSRNASRGTGRPQTDRADPLPLRHSLGITAGGRASRLERCDRNDTAPWTNRFCCATLCRRLRSRGGQEPPTRRPRCPGPLRRCGCSSSWSTRQRRSRSARCSTRCGGSGTRPSPSRARIGSPSGCSAIRGTWTKSRSAICRASRS